MRLARTRRQGRAHAQAAHRELAKWRQGRQAAPSARRGNTQEGPVRQRARRAPQASTRDHPVRRCACRAVLACTRARPVRRARARAAPWACSRQAPRSSAQHARPGPTPPRRSPPVTRARRERTPPGRQRRARRAPRGLTRRQRRRACASRALRGRSQAQGRLTVPHAPGASSRLLRWPFRLPRAPFAQQALTLPRRLMHARFALRAPTHRKLLRVASVA